MDKAIQLGGGMEVQQACKEIRTHQSGCLTGKAVITTGGNLRAKYVIHTAGPIWKGGLAGEPILLSSCYSECLQLASRSGVQSIAFPSISTGFYKYPLERAAEVALTTVKEFMGNGGEAPNRVQFILPDGETYAYYATTFSKLGLSLYCLIG